LKIKDFSTISEFGSISLGNIIGSSFGVIFWFYFAAILSIKEYGEISHLIGIATLTAFIGTLGLSYIPLTYSTKEYEKLRGQAAAFLSILIVPISFILFFLLEQKFTIIPFIGLSLFLFSSSDLLGVKHRKEYSIIYVLSKIGQLSLSIVFYTLFGIEGILLGFGISLIILNYRYIYSLKFFDFKFNQIFAHLKFAIGANGASLTLILTGWFDKLLIGPIFGFESQGTLHFGIQILIGLSILPVSLMQFLIPEETSGNKRKRLKLFALLFSVILGLVMFIVAPIIVDMLFDKYVESIETTKFLALGIIPLTYSTLANSTYIARGKSRLVLIGSILFVISEIITLIVLGYLMSLEGMVLGVLISLCIQSIFLGVMNRFKF